MGQELAIPQSFQGKGMSQAFAAQLNASDDNLSEGIGQSYGVIGYKGKVWSIRYRGERKTVLRPDDGTPSSYLDVIILGQAKTKSKSFYKKYDPNTSDGDRPICASMDGVVPDADVAQKQCDSCALCPRNVWKTDAATGRKGRECTDYKRLAVLVLPTQTKPTLGAPLLEPLFLRVPPDSLNSLAIMGETMGNQGFHYSSYITRIVFDDQKAHPCMVFRPHQPLTDGEATVILELRNDATVGRITGGDIAIGAMKAVEQALAAPGTVASGLTAAATPQPTTQVTPAQQTQSVVQQTAAQPAPVSSGLAGQVLRHVAGDQAPGASSTPTVAAPLATLAPSISTDQTLTTGLLSTGLGGVNTVSGAPSQSNSATGLGLPTAGVADAGSPEESDADLDAKIAALIAPK